MNALCQIIRITIVGHIAGLLMVYHLRDTTHLKAHTRHTTCHRLHDGVWQIILQRRQNKDINGIIDIHNLLHIAHIAQGIRRQR